jgi:endonuclease/exonuclease/phosphatase family metal-dependent hydrolase
MRPGVRGAVRVVAAAGLLALALPCSARAQAPVRLLTFNIRYGTANDGEHRWPNRRAAVIATIADHAPHVLGVQEALRFQLDELAAALPRYRELGVGRDDGKQAGEYAAILVDTARFTVLSTGTLWLSDTPETPGSMHWGNRITRITTWGRLVDRATGDTVRVYNAHWDHESQPSRERSARLMLARILGDGARSDGVLVLGDFNSDESNPAFRALIADPGAGLRDTFRDRHPAATTVGTFNSFRGDSTAGKIDAVLVGRGWRVIDAGIDRRKHGELWASDHFAVWAAVVR